MAALPWDQALRALGVDPAAPVPAADARALDARGFVVLPAVMAPADIEALHALCDGGNMRLERLDGGHGALLRLLCHSRLLGAVWHVLRRPFALGGVAFRDPRPGFGAQGLHVDSAAVSAWPESRVVTAIAMIDAMDEENGPTRVVPGTHAQRRAIPKRLTDPAAHADGEERVTGAAGAVLVMNGHLWHSGTRNRSERHRRVVQLSFFRRATESAGTPRVAVELDAPAPLRAVLA